MEAMDELERPVQQHKIAVRYQDKNQLYKAYMPFVQNGALLVPTKKQYDLGDYFLLSIQLLDIPDEIFVEGPVVWLTPNCAQGGREAGIGVQFTGDDGQALRNKIENILAGMLGSEKKTNTM